MTTRPILEWYFDFDALADEVSTDGCHGMLTNLGPELSLAEVLARYKGHKAVEQRYSNFMGPIAVGPMFETNNRRIEALISVICLAATDL